jgi:hypothetical protein
MTVFIRKPQWLKRAALALLLTMTGVAGPCRAESPARPSLIVEDIRSQNAKLRLSSLPDFVSVEIYLDKGSAKGRAIVIIEVVEADRIDNQIRVLEETARRRRVNHILQAAPPAADRDLGPGSAHTMDLSAK